MSYYPSEADKIIARCKARGIYAHAQQRIAGESITSGAAAVLNAYTGALRTEFEHLLDDMREGE